MCSCVRSRGANFRYYIRNSYHCAHNAIRRGSNTIHSGALVSPSLLAGLIPVSVLLGMEPVSRLLVDLGLWWGMVVSKTYFKIDQ